MVDNQYAPLDGLTIITYGYVYRQNRSGDGRGQRSQHRLGDERGAATPKGRSWRSPTCPARPASAASARSSSPHGPKIVLPCDVQKDADIDRVFERGPRHLRPARFPRPLDRLRPAAGAAQALRRDEPRGLAPGDGHQRLQPGGRQPGGRAADVRRRHDPDDQLLRRRKGRARLQRDGRVQGGPGTQRPLPGLGPRPQEHPRQLHQRRPDAHPQLRRHRRLRPAARARRREGAVWAATSIPRNSARRASICSAISPAA